MVRCDGEFTEDNDYICGFGHGENVCSSHHCDFCETGVCSPDCDDEYCARTKKPSSDEMNECMLCAYPMQEGEEWNQDENDWFKDGKKIQWNAWNEFSYPEDYDAETFEAYKPKKVKRVQKIDPSRMSGTSLQGYIKTNRTELRKTFGNPNMGPSGDGKVKSSGWVVSIDGKVCTIYDKREQGKKGTKFFNIGGRDMFSPLLVAQELSKTRGEKVHAIETSSEWDDEKSFKENMKRNRDFPDSHPIITPARAMEYSRNVARYGAEGFGVIAGRGFQMEFPNGYRVSVVFAPGNYGDHYDNTGDMMEHSLNPPQEWESRTAELAVFKPEGGLLDFGDEGDQVRGWINPAFVSEMFGLAAKGDEEGMKELAMKSHLYGAEGLEFTDWANQETKHHGKTSLKEWADHEIKTHGGKMSFQDWAKHEDKSHIRRFGGERVIGGCGWEVCEGQKYGCFHDNGVGNCQNCGERRGLQELFVDDETGNGTCDDCLIPKRHEGGKYETVLGSCVDCRGEDGWRGCDLCDFAYCDDCFEKHTTTCRECDVCSTPLWEGTIDVGCDKGCGAVLCEDCGGDAGNIIHSGWSIHDPMETGEEFVCGNCSRLYGAESKTDLMDLKVGQEIKINGLMREGEIPSQTKLRHHREWDSDGEYFPEYREGYVDVPIADDGSISTDSQNALYYAVKYWYGSGEDITDGYFIQFKARPMDEAEGTWKGKPQYYPIQIRWGQLRWDKDQDRFFIDGLSEKLSKDGGYIYEDGDILEARAYEERGIYSITPLEKKSAEARVSDLGEDEDLLPVGTKVRSYDFWKSQGKDSSYIEGVIEKIAPSPRCSPDCMHYHIRTTKTVRQGKEVNENAIGEIFMTHPYERFGWTLKRAKHIQVMDAEELKKDSCCCGATKSNPCACMIQGVMECNATCPCSLEKFGAEGLVYDRPMLDSDGKPVTEWECYENNKEKIDKMPSKWTCSYCEMDNIEADVVPTAERMYGNPVSKSFLEYLCTNCGRNTWMPYHFHEIEYGVGVGWCASCEAVYPDEDDTPSICDCGGEVIRGAENWGGDPTGKLALMLQKARDKAKKPKKPLKIEKLGADSGWNMPPGVFSIPGHPDDEEYEAVWEWFSEGFPEEDFAPKLWELEGKPGDSAEKWWEDISEPITLYHPVFGHYDGHKPKEEFEEVFDRHYDFISDEAKKMWEGWYENDPLWVEDYVFEDDKNAETSGEWKPTYKDFDSNYFFLVGEDEDGRSKIVSYHRTFEEAKTAADASKEPLEIEEHRSSKNISPEEQEKQDKDYQEWRKRELTGELFEDFWWKDEMNRYGNSDSPYLRYSTIPDKDKKAFDDTKFFDEHILPKEYNWREKESHQWIAHRWGISERLAQIIESSRTFGMYMNQRNSPATIKKYRQRILDAFDGYTPTTDKEKKMLEIVRNDMATRGVKGPSPSYWCASGRGILKKPELSYAYDDYYTMPIPFMGYGKIADHEKYGIHPACKGCDQCETYESEGIGQWEIGEQLEEAQMNAETFEGIPQSVSILSPLEDVRCDKYEMEVNFENEDIVIVSGEELKAIIDDGWDLDSVSSFEGAGMSLLFTRNPNRAYAAESFATEGKFFVCDACEETLPLKLRNRSLKVAQEFGMGIGDICRPCVKRIKSYEEEVKKLNPPKTWADYYNAPTKGIDTFTQPFEESSLDSGTVKKVLVGLGIGGLALFGYNKWK